MVSLCNESIDLIDAFHPQTILAYSMNGRDLDVAHGGPLRLRLWDDRGYDWYAGV
jgi:DMSO/TMAO reductase YedYZ molybdopterin-dependent catalytic subunit